MKKALKIAVLLSASVFASAAIAGPWQGNGHQRPPFPVVKQHILYRMQKAEKALPGRISCVEGANNFHELHACFPQRMGGKWNHHGGMQHGQPMSVPMKPANG